MSADQAAERLHGVLAELAQYDLTSRQRALMVDVTVVLAERDALATTVQRVRALADEWEHPSRPQVAGWMRHAARCLRAALDGEEASDA